MCLLNVRRCSIKYLTTYQEWPAFTITGVSSITASGGGIFDAVRLDGRWEALRRLGGEDATLYGVASFDKAATQGAYRYTLGAKDTAVGADALLAGEALFSIPIRQAGWLVFELDSFAAQWGQFWRDDPYRLVQELGWIYDAGVGLHIDVFPATFASKRDAVAFMMPVRCAVKVESVCGCRELRADGGERTTLAMRSKPTAVGRRIGDEKSPRCGSGCPGG